MQATLSPEEVSDRAYDSILKVAHAIVHLVGSDRIAAAHISEATQCRGLDRNY